jgi:uncharacterized protein with ATP-grasp and redox domains
MKDNNDECTNPTSPERSECLLKMEDLISSLRCQENGFLRTIKDVGPDCDYWDSVLSDIPEGERNWLKAPWVVSEFYLYRRIAEAFSYFETGYDSFAAQKSAGLVEAMPSIEEIAKRLPASISSDNKAEVVKLAVLTSLWGNKMDLSLWPAAQEGGSAVDNKDRILFGDSMDANASFIVDDHSETAVSILCDSTGASDSVVDIIVDNAGAELVCDLFLAHSLLSTECCSKVRFHTKGMPTFVSDATTEDSIETIAFLTNTNASGSTSKIARELNEYVNLEKIEFISDLFWCHPTPFWDMPNHIQERLAGSKLVFVKGDANYRRLLGERQWPLDTLAADVLSYWPVPVCALRTFKAEIGCGVSVEAQSRAERDDANWKVSGKWGVVQVGGDISSI